MNLIQKIRYALLTATTWTLSRLPLGVHRFIGRGLGYFVCYVIRYRKDLVDNNLSHAFVEKSEKERKEIRNRFYKHFGTIFAEAIWFGSTTNLKRLERSGLCRIEGQEYLNECYDQGKSVMALASHRGNFEIHGGFKTYSAYDCELKVDENCFFEIYKQLSDPVWDKYMKRNRIAPVVDKEHYDALVETKASLRYMLTHRNNRVIFNFITDQYPYGDANRIPVKFFGRDTFSMQGGAAFAIKFKLPIVYLDMRCNENGGYTMRYTKIADDASTMTAKEIMDTYYRMLEDDIKQQPWNYLWTHNRWK